MTVVTNKTMDQNLQHQMPKNHDQPKRFTKTRNQSTDKKPHQKFGKDGKKSHTDRFGHFDKSAKRATPNARRSNHSEHTPNQPSIKRVYINPKSADENLAKRLTDKLAEANLQGEQRYTIKKKAKTE